MSAAAIDQGFFPPIDAHCGVGPPQPASESARRIERPCGHGHAQVVIDQNLHLGMKSNADVEVIMYRANVSVNLR
jgi:hypothetical protein